MQPDRPRVREQCKNLVVRTSEQLRKQVGQQSFNTERIKEIENGLVTNVADEAIYSLG